MIQGCGGGGGAGNSWAAPWGGMGFFGVGAENGGGGLSGPWDSGGGGSLGANAQVSFSVVCPLCLSPPLFFFNAQVSFSVVCLFFIFSLFAFFN